MRRSERTALIGLLAVAGVALAAGRYAADSLERQVGERAQSAIERVGVSGVDVTVNGLNVELFGRVADAEERDAVLAAVAEARGVARLVDNLMIIEPLVDLRPAALRLEKDADRVTLTGEAPSVEARDLLAARIQERLEGRAFLNLMRTQDRRASAAWLSAAEAAVDAVAALDVGAASVADGELVIEGSARDARLRDRLVARLTDRLRDGFVLRADIATPPPLLTPYVFAMRRVPEGYQLETCAAPDPETQALIVDKLGEVAPALGRVDACPLAYGAPNPAWGDAVARAIDSLALLSEGEARIVDAAAQVEGVARSGSTGADGLERLREEAVEGWPPAYAARAEIRASLPVADPFEMTVVKRDGATSLSGVTPSLGRAETWAAALDADSRLEPARGAPERWSDAVDAVVALMARLELGVATLTNFDILIAAPGDRAARALLRAELQETTPPQYRVRVVEARAPRELMDGAMAEVEERVAAGPRGALASAVADLTRPPEEDADEYVFVARRDVDGAAAISGFAGDETSLAAIETYASAKLGGDRLTVDLRLGDGSPPSGWQRTIFASLDALAELDSGEAVTESGAAYLRGRASRAIEARRAMAAARAKTPETVQIFSWIDVREDGAALAAQENAQIALEPEACVSAANAVVASTPVPFEPGAANLSATSDPIFDAIAATLLRCPDAAVEVGGHTDSLGSEEGNETLSRQRAFAVRLALIARGVTTERLTHVGYGASQPTADNETEEGRAANRRIEFKLAP